MTKWGFSANLDVATEITADRIPDYRSKDVGLYARSTYRPVQYKEFLDSAEIRKRYWARNYVGWPKFSTIAPNENHYALAKLEKENKVPVTITQNVDNLHCKAGSENVIELHGTAFSVICLKCDYRASRHDYQYSLDKINAGIDDITTMIRPDGDVEITQETINNFKVSPCPKCGSFLKPDIVFFGDNVPKRRVELIREEVSKSDGILVLGSSLTVFSSYRIILQAKEEHKKVAVVSIGPTRADHLIDLKISTRCSEILPMCI